MTTNVSANGARLWVEGRNSGSPDPLLFQDSTLARHGRAALPWLAAIGALLAGWQFRDRGWLNAEHGLGYLLGVASVSCMAVLLIYPLRKRIKWLAFLGPSGNWFRVHMTMGVIAPIAALYHCSFAVGSLNSQIALYSMLLVAGSGLIGRYLYRQINQALRTARRKPKRRSAPRPAHMAFLDLVDERLDELDSRSLAAFDRPFGWLAIMTKQAHLARRERRAMMLFARRHLDKNRANSVLRQHRGRILDRLDRHLLMETSRLRHALRLRLYQKLFGLWHVAHLPFFVLLLISVALHIAAVHLY